MNKTSTLMIDALLGGHRRKRGNDEVGIYRSQPDGAQVVWFYHGNNIAWVNNHNQVVVTLCGYGTVSTRSRLNDLCSVVAPHICFSQHKGEQYICYTGTDGDGNRWDMPEKIEDLEQAFVVGMVPEHRRREAEGK